MEYEKLCTYTQNLSVLFVEDDSIVLRAMCSLLDNYFNKIDICANGRDGLEQYKIKLEEKNHYDIVITDINMPYLSGIEMAKEIKKLFKDQTIIFVSAHNNEELLSEANNLEIEYYLLKPIKLKELEEAIFNAAQNIVNQKNRVLQI